MAIPVVDVDILGDDRFDAVATRLAVSRFETQIGSSKSYMWLGLISAIVSFPIVG